MKKPDFVQLCNKPSIICNTYWSTLEVEALLNKDAYYNCGVTLSQVGCKTWS